MEEVKHTPMINQYLEIKKQYPQMLVFYRMGDFYELFFEDAIKASKILGITLTKRGQSGGINVEMAGVPHNSINQYLIKLIKIGEQAVIVDQVGESNNKGPMERKISRIITPGTISDTYLLEEKKDNYLCAILELKDQIVASYLSVTSGEFIIETIRKTELNNFLERINPTEILVKESLYRYYSQEYCKKYFITTISDWHFDNINSVAKLCEHFKVKTLEGFGIDNNDPALIVAYIALSYAKSTQQNDLIYINSIKKTTHDDHLSIDHISRINLEINNTIKGDSNLSLFTLLDHCSTNHGSRLLRYLLNNPICNKQILEARLDAISFLVKENSINYEITKILSQFSDIERIATKISLTTAKPRDLSSLRTTLNLLPNLKSILNRECNSLEIRDIINSINNIPLELLEILNQSLLTEPNNNLSEGNIINNGYNDELDRLRNLYNNCNEHLKQITLEEIEKTKIPNLKIEYNKIHGYYIEISNSHINKIPENYKRVQTLKNYERYTTIQLKQFEEEILQAGDKMFNLEKTLYLNLLQILSIHCNYLKELSIKIAFLDVFNNLAIIAIKNYYTRPVFINNTSIHIKDGRHPVIETQVKQFIANSLELNNNKYFLLITGPNMGGKSTYMRQNAIIVLLAYCGFFVPAKEVTLGPIDKIFTRIGASDDLSMGKSTFMIEMIEAANILNNATDKSLVIIDEIGRGTSTYDGLSLAYGISDYLIKNIKCFTLFSTHYFELTKLEEEFPQAKNVYLSAIEDNDEIVFLHNVIEGKAQKSYGIWVAKLAGIPPIVLKNSQNYLFNLEQNTNNASST